MAWAKETGGKGYDYDEMKTMLGLLYNFIFLKVFKKPVKSIASGRTDSGVHARAQVISFKTTGKRVFRMAPIHHHFELSGWAEPQVTVRFWIISIILAMLGLATLKLR